MKKIDNDEPNQLAQINNGSNFVSGLDAVQLDETIENEKKPWGTYLVV